MFTNIRNFTLGLMGLAISFAISGVSVAQSTDQSKEEIEAIIKEYIAKNPEIVVNAIRQWQENQRIAKLLPTLQTYRDYLENDPKAPTMGNPDGDVTIVEFYDYRCGYCRRHFPEIVKLIENDGNIKWVARQYPILDREGQKQVSKIAARAAIAAHKQGMFKEFHYSVMTDQGSLTEDRLFEIAEAIGLNMLQLRADMNASVTDKRITNSLIVGQELEITGTPAFVIGDELIIGAQGHDALKAAIARTRARNKAKAGK